METRILFVYLWIIRSFVEYIIRIFVADSWIRG